MVQCAGITNNDTQCTREGTSGGFCASGDNYCWQHVNQDPTESMKRTFIFAWTCISGILDIINAASEDLFSYFVNLVKDITYAQIALKCILAFFFFFLPLFRSCTNQSKEQCKALTLKNERCSRMESNYTGYCWQHICRWGGWIPLAVLVVLMNMTNISTDSYEIHLKRINALPRIWIEVISLILSFIVVVIELRPLLNLCDSNPNKAGKSAQQIVQDV
jgi:hypothetical protein